MTRFWYTLKNLHPKLLYVGDYISMWSYDKLKLGILYRYGILKLGIVEV
jgi:hypothetical protein